MQIACHLIDGPWLRFFLCPAHVNFQCLYRWVPIQWSSKYYEKSETLLFWVIHDLSVKLGATQPEWRSTCISFHAFMLLGSYAKDYTGIWVLSIIYLFVYSHCSFPSCAKKLIKTEPKWFYWYSDATVLQSRQFQIIQENFNYLSKRTCI